MSMVFLSKVALGKRAVDIHSYKKFPFHLNGFETIITPQAQTLASLEQKRSLLGLPRSAQARRYSSVLEKGVWLREITGISFGLIGEVLGVSYKAVERAERAYLSNRALGRRGRPPLLTPEEKETLLKEVATAQNESSDLRDKVR